MPRKRTSQPSVDFHMTTRSRLPKQVAPDLAISSAEDSPLSSPGTTLPSTPPNIPSSHKRKISESSAEDRQILPVAKRPARTASATVKRPKSKRRPAPKRSNDSSPASDNNNSSPAVPLPITPPDTAESSRQNSTFPSAEPIESPPEPAAKPQPEAVAAIAKDSPQFRRSLRNAKANNVTSTPTTTEQKIQSSSPPEGGDSSSQPTPHSPETGSGGKDASPKPKRAVKIADRMKISLANTSEYKDRVFWPKFDKNNPTVYINDGATQHQPGEGDAKSESRSPQKPARGGGRGGRGGGNGGGRKGKGKGKGARGGSADPPERRLLLNQQEKGMLSILKARQIELKRFFSTVGAQQVDILDQMANRDLNKITKKANAHKKVSEHDEVMEALQALMEDAEDLARQRHNTQLEAEMRQLEAGKEVIEQKFKTRIEEARKEHLAGAEGDIILFERAYRAAHDDMHTESGSDVMDGFPQYHELPEPNTQPRGYSSTKITDEKSFKRQLEETYDEQARQEVLNEEVIIPLLKQIEKRKQEEKIEHRRQKSQTMGALSDEATKQLEQIEGYLIPRPFDMGEANSYALSALADVSEWVAQQHPQKQYIYMPLTKGEKLPASALDFSPLPGRPVQPPPPLPQQAYQQILRASSRPRGRKLKYPPLTNEQPKTPATASAPTLPSPQAPRPSLAPAISYTGGPEPVQALPYPPQRIVSSGPGQPIAPAPPKAAPPAPRSNVNIFRHNTRYPPPPPPPPQTPPQNSRPHSRHNSFTVASPNNSVPPNQQPQQFVFQTPPMPPPVNAGSPTSPVGPGGGQQTKMSMTFVNQTIESRNAAAQAVHDGNGGNSGANAKGIGAGKRTLLPKGY